MPPRKGGRPAICCCAPGFLLGLLAIVGFAVVPAVAVADRFRLLGVVLDDVSRQDVRVQADHRLRAAPLATASSISSMLTEASGLGTMPLSCVTEAVTGVTRRPPLPG